MRLAKKTAADDLPDGAETGLHLAYEYNIGDPELNALTTQLRADRARIDQEERELAERTAVVAARLVQGEALPVRDAAALLSVSPQRISQVAPRSGRAASVKQPAAKSGNSRTTASRSTRAAEVDRRSS